MVTPVSPATSQAKTLSGSILASAPKIVSVMRMPARPRAATGAGVTQLVKLPSGAITVSGRKYPALLGMLGSRIERMQAYRHDFVQDSGALMAPLHCGEVPVKSALSASPLLLSLTWMVMGSGV